MGEKTRREGLGTGGELGEKRGDDIGDKLK